MRRPSRWLAAGLLCTAIAMGSSACSPTSNQIAIAVIRGTVTIDGAPAGGIFVSLRRGGTNLASAATDETGSFRFGGSLEQGIYSVILSVPAGVSFPMPIQQADVNASPIEVTLTFVGTTDT